MFWYQINPYYFSQIIDKKNLPGKDEDLNFYRLVLKNLQRIKDLKCDGIWIMPLYIKGEENKKGNGSPYAVKEFKIDHQFGPEEDLINLVNECHKLDLKVITEYIPNHLSHDAVFVKEHPEAVYMDADGNPLYDQDWSDTVKLKHKEPIVRDFTRDNMKRILGNYGFDGFRIDMAHCPYYDIDGKPYQGEWDAMFWNKVLDDPFFKQKEYIFLAEVYDDRNHEYMGYGDHIRLMKNDMIVYDKKIHDLFAHKLKNYEIHEPIQELFYRELFYQYEAMKIAEKKNYINPPFLRIPSNHDDNPGIGNFGGVQQYNLAFTVQSLMTGQSMIYNGDEFGLSVKLSRILENVYGENSDLLETNEVYFIDDKDQENIFKNVKDTLKIRSNLITLKHKIIVAKLLTREGNLSNDLLSFVYFSLNSKEITVIASNLSNNLEKQWGKIDEFYPSLDEAYRQFTWKEILHASGINTEYKITDILNQKEFGKRKIDEEFWIGLNGLETQVLKIKGF